MNLKKTKAITIVAAIVAILLLAIDSGTGKDIFGILGIIVCFGVMVFWIVFGRGPHCGSHVGRSPGKYCKHCGKKVEE